MVKWEKIECHKNGTYSLSSKSGRRATGPFRDLLETVIGREELIELVKKARSCGKITDECYTRVMFEVL